MVKYKTRVKRIILKLRAHKLMTAIVITLFTVIILIIGGLLLSRRAWNNYEINYSKNINNAKIDINNIIVNTLSVTNTSPTNKINALLQLQSKLAKDAVTYCKVDTVIGWQSFIKQLSDKMKACQQQKENINQLLDKIGNMARYLKAEQSLSDIITKVIDETNQNNQTDTWNKIEAYWRQAAVDVSGLADVYQFNSTKATANTSLVAIADVWHRLSDANNTKDRQKFETERTNLDKAYAGLAAISDTNKIQVDKLITEFSSSYGKIN